jgi:pimeloyl-ACP methyl ester carboxylesterase
VYGAILDQVAADGAVNEQLADLIVPLFFAPDIDRRAPDLPRALRRRLWSFAPEVLQRSIVPLGRIIFDRPDALPILSQIEAPTMILAGAEDRARPPQESEIMARLLNCRLTVVRRCGHTATLEQPEAVNAALLGFLHQLDWTRDVNQRAAG